MQKHIVEMEHQMEQIWTENLKSWQLIRNKHPEKDNVVKKFASYNF